MIGGYAKSYIRSLSDYVRKYRPDAHGTNVHIVHQKRVQKARSEYEQLAMDIPSSIPTDEDAPIQQEKDVSHPTTFCIPYLIRYAKHPFDDSNVRAANKHFFR